MLPLVDEVNGLDVLVEAADFPPEELEGFELTLADTFLVAGVVAGLGLIPLEFLVFSVPSDDLVLDPVSLVFDLAVVESPADLAADFVDNLGDIADDLVRSFALAGVVVVLGSTFLLLFGIVLMRLFPEDMLHPSSFT